MSQETCTETVFPDGVSAEGRPYSAQKYGLHHFYDAVFLCAESGELTRKLEVPCRTCLLILACPVRGLFLLLGMGCKIVFLRKEKKWSSKKGLTELWRRC